MIFKGLSVAKNFLRPEIAPLNTTFDTSLLRKQNFTATFSNISFSTLNLKNICLAALKMPRLPMFLNLHATMP